jgi:hypothetical protein
MSVASGKPMGTALAGVAKTNGTIAAAKVSAAIPACTFKGMSATIFLRRLWKILQLTTSVRQANRHVNSLILDNPSRPCEIGRAHHN